MEDENIPLARTLVSATGAMAYASASNNTHSAAMRFYLIVFFLCVSPWLDPITFSQTHLSIPRSLSSMTEGSILELGCGSGWAAAELAKILPPHVKLTVVDLSSEMLRLARSRLPEAVTILKDNAEALSIPSNSYDATYSSLCLQVCVSSFVYRFFLSFFTPNILVKACRESRQHDQRSLPRLARISISPHTRARYSRLVS